MLLLLSARVLLAWWLPPTSLPLLPTTDVRASVWAPLPWLVVDCTAIMALENHI